MPCPESSYSLPVPIVALVRPIEKVGLDSFKIAMGSTILGYLGCNIHRFAVLDRLHGFCPDTISLPYEPWQDSLLNDDELYLEVGTYSERRVAILTNIKEFEHDASAVINDGFSNGKYFYGKVVGIKKMEEKFTLQEKNIFIDPRDVTNLGYDTMEFTDQFYQIKMQTSQGVHFIYSRDYMDYSTNNFLVGETYLVSTEVNDQKNWVIPQFVFRKNYHSDAYFEIYEEAQ